MYVCRISKAEVNSQRERRHSSATITVHRQCGTHKRHGYTIVEYCSLLFILIEAELSVQGLKVESQSLHRCTHNGTHNDIS